MKITEKWLNKKNACADGKNWVLENYPDTDGTELVENLIRAQKLDWANWLIVRIMARPQYLAYAIFAAEQVIDFFENKYPHDRRPWLAIDAAKKSLADDTSRNSAAAGAAGGAAWAVAETAGAAWAVAGTAGAAGDVIKIKILKYGTGLLKKIREIE